MKAIKIDVDYGTGLRAGNVLPNDPNTPGDPSWQCLDEHPGGFEFRLVLDGDTSRYVGVEGIEIYDDADALQAELDKCFTPTDAYVISNDALMVESIRQKPIDLNKYAPNDPDFLKKLYELGVLGISKATSKCRCAKECCAAWGRMHEARKAKAATPPRMPLTA